MMPGTPAEWQMTVTVEAHGLQPNSPPLCERLENVHTVAEAWARLGRRQAAGLAILVNGRLADWQTVLQDGDVVRLIPAPGGG